MVPLQTTCIFFIYAIIVSSAFPRQVHHGKISENDLNELEAPIRLRRSFQPGGPNFPGSTQQNGGWSVNPNVGRDENGNTKTNIEVQHTGPNHDVNAGWGKVVRGPNKAKPTWHVGGTFKW